MSEPFDYDGAKEKAEMIRAMRHLLIRQFGGYDQCAARAQWEVYFAKCASKEHGAASFAEAITEVVNRLGLEAGFFRQF